LFTNFKDLEKKPVRAKFESLYLGLDLRNKWALSYPMVFMLRRAIFVLIAVFPTEWYWLQLQFLIFLTSIYMIYIGRVKPNLSYKS
jgi:hypothetical protein